MPRIDPLQLLKCLSVLLSPNGGIKSKEEVQRLASLMTKFSKKLVSKCIYIQILKTTKTDLLDMFMAAGGWTLIHTWLSDAIVAKNWPLIQELIELLLMCPVDVERLKSNSCPKLIKGLSKENSNENVKVLSSKLVEEWLRIVKGETEAVRAHHMANVEIKNEESNRIRDKVDSVGVVKVKDEIDRTEVSHNLQNSNTDESKNAVHITKHENLINPELIPKVEVQKLVIKKEELEGVDSNNDQLPVYKITIRDGKQVLAKVSSSEKSNKKSSADDTLEDSTVIENAKTVTKFSNVSNVIKKEEVDETSVKLGVESQKYPSLKSKVKTEKQDSTDSSKSHKDSSKRLKDSQSSKISSKDKKSKSESSKDKSKEKEVSKDKSKDKSRDKEKDRENNKLKERKPSTEKSSIQFEKDKATLAKLIPPAISKLGKIPKKPKTEETLKPSSDVKKPIEKPNNEVRKPPPPEPVRKPSISIEQRKPIDPSSRPKTVKTFNSKFRSTGLEQEVKPPPPRPVKKPSIPIEKKPIKLPLLKRPSPPKELSLPPEKKLKPMLGEITIDEAKKNEKTGGTKLIPLRSKPSFLQESDMFMDALNASSKKEPRKRKRRTSNSKDGPDAKKESSVGKEEDGNKDSTPPSSPTNTIEEKSPPIIRPLLKFYQDTLESNDDEKDDDDDDDDISIEKKSEESVELKEQSEEQDQRSPTTVEEDGSEINSNDPSDENESTRRISKDESPKEAETKDQDSSEDAPGRYPKGVLIYHKTRKGPKKTVKWKAEKDLFAIKYFELDETERVNVTKTFTDMKQMERSNEREAFLLARKLPQDDIMEEKIQWQPLIPIDVPPSLVEWGKRSREKDVQYAREKVILQALYFSRNMIPDSAAEPDLEIHATTDPTVIPLEDVTGNPDSVNDFQNTPWPEPKPIIIPQSPPPQFQQSPPQFGSFPNQQFPEPLLFPNQSSIHNNMPMSGGGMMVPNNMNVMNNMGPGNGDWRTGDGKVLPINEMGMQMDMYNQGGPPIGMPGIPGMPGMGVPGPEMNFNMMVPEDMGPGGPFPPPQGYPIGGPHPPGMYPFRGGGGGGRGPRGMRNAGRNSNQMGPRGPNAGQWFPPGGPHNWQGGGGNSGNNRGNRGWGNQNRAVCKHFRGGFCRHGEKCPFIHPGVNAPQY